MALASNSAAVLFQTLFFGILMVFKAFNARKCAVNSGFCHISPQWATPVRVHMAKCTICDTFSSMQSNQMFFFSLYLNHLHTWKIQFGLIINHFSRVIVFTQFSRSTFSICLMILCTPIHIIFFLSFLTWGFHNHFVKIMYMTRKPIERRFTFTLFTIQ